MKPVSRALVAGASALALAAPAGPQTVLPAGVIAQASDRCFTAAQSELEGILARQPNVREAKNVILFIGDGMSIPTITAARIRVGQKQGGDGESHHLAFEDLLPHVALARTYTNDAQVADSAPTATAMVAGIKANKGTIGVTQAVENDVCASQKGHEVTTIFELDEAAGYATGIVSTARITHATPAATYAKTAQRDWENDSQLSDEAKVNGCKDVAAQLVDRPAGNGFEVILGGGRSNFMLAGQADPEAADKTGARSEGYMNGPGAVVVERADLSEVDTEAPDFLQQALVPLEESETHSGDDVGIYAQGPWSHLFDGVVEQNLIYHVMAHATRLPEKAALSPLSN